MELIKKINDYYDNHAKKDVWELSDFKNLKKMENDTRGSFGEQLVSDWFHLMPEFHIDQDKSDNSVHEDGHYDLKVNGVRIEVKTSCLSSSGWQHEPLYAEDVCDLVFFLDFSYNNIGYFTIVSNTALPLGKDSNVIPGKHGTLRKNKNDGYKLDFSNKNIKDLIKNKHCLSFTNDTPESDILVFIKEKMNEFIQSV